MARKKSSASPDTARRIWLAGIGAYGRAFTDAQESLARLSGETSKAFDDLVEKGEEIERAVEEKGRAVVARVAPSGVNIEDRIRRMRERLGMGLVRDDDQPATAPMAAEAVSDRLDRLERKVDHVLAVLEALLDAPDRRTQDASPSAKPARRAASKTIKTAAKKPVRRKSAKAKSST